MQLSVGDSAFEGNQSQVEEHNSVQDPKLSLEIPAAEESLGDAEQKITVEDGRASGGDEAP